MKDKEYYEINLIIHKGVFREMNNISTIAGLTQEAGKSTEIILKIIETIKKGEKEVTLINKRDVKDE